MQPLPACAGFAALGAALCGQSLFLDPPPTLAGLERAARRALAAQFPASGEAVAWATLGWLRLAEPERAARALRSTTRQLPGLSTGDAREVDWLVFSHHWYLRATGDGALVAGHWPLLEAALRRTDGAPPQTDYVPAALVAHAWLCGGDLLDQLDLLQRPERWATGPPTPRPGAALTAAGVRRLLDLEHASWLSDLGRFGDRHVSHAPRPADLLPAALGLLVASGDRQLSHLYRTLADLETGPVPDDGGIGIAAMLAAAAQLGSAAGRDAIWGQLSPARTQRAAAAARFDAACHAVTGLRMASGAGVDDGWLRLSPWLPPGHDRLSCRGLLARGRRLDVDLVAVAGGPRRLAVQIRLDAAAGAGALRVVVASGAEQHIGVLAPGLPFACDLALE